MLFYREVREKCSPKSSLSPNWPWAIGVSRSGFGILRLEFGIFVVRISGSWFRVWCFVERGFRSLGFRVRGFTVWVSGSGFSRFGISGSGFRVRDSGFSRFGVSVFSGFVVSRSGFSGFRISVFRDQGSGFPGSGFCGFGVSGVWR